MSQNSSPPSPSGELLTTLWNPSSDALPPGRSPNASPTPSDSSQRSDDTWSARLPG